MMLHELRALVVTMKDDAAAHLRFYGRVLGVREAFTESIVPALGEISLAEACDALEREALEARARAMLSKGRRSRTS